MRLLSLPLEVRVPQYLPLGGRGSPPETFERKLKSADRADRRDMRPFVLRPSFPKPSPRKGAGLRRRPLSASSKAPTEPAGETGGSASAEPDEVEPTRMRWKRSPVRSFSEHAVYTLQTAADRENGSDRCGRSRFMFFSAGRRRKRLSYGVGAGGPFAVSIRNTCESVPEARKRRPRS